jgi:hypothetical protein
VADEPCFTAIPSPGAARLSSMSEDPPIASAERTVATPSDEPVVATVVEGSFSIVADAPAASVADDELVACEVVKTAARPHPLRFGIKAMFGLIVLCSLQFALVRWLGPIFGIALGGIACLAAFTALLAVSIVYRPRDNSRVLDYMDQLAIRLTLAVFVLFVAFVAAGGGALVWQQVTREWRDQALRNELGFTAAKEHAWVGDRMYSALVIESVEPGKPFDRAGLRQNDAVLFEPGLDVYERFEENRGQEMTLNVAPVPPGLLNTSAPIQTANVKIPAAES